MLKKKGPRVGGWNTYDANWLLIRNYCMTFGHSRLCQKIVVLVTAKNIVTSVCGILYYKLVVQMSKVQMAGVELNTGADCSRCAILHLRNMWVRLKLSFKCGVDDIRFVDRWMRYTKIMLRLLKINLFKLN